MTKYIIFAILIVLLVLNYCARKVLELVLKKEVTQKQEIIFKSVLYVIMLIGVVYIMLL